MPEIDGGGSDSSSTSIVDNYVVINSVTVNNHTITLNFTVKAKIPSGATVSIGYDYPKITRTNGTRIYLSGYSTGTYTKNINTLGLICQVSVNSRLNAYSYEQIHVYKKYWDIPTSTKVSFRTVTLAEEIAQFIALECIGFKLEEYADKLKIKEQLIEGFTLTIGVILIIANIDIDVTEGNYIKTTTWYSSSGNTGYLNIKIEEWDKQLDYMQGEEPISTSTAKYKLISF